MAKIKNPIIGGGGTYQEKTVTPSTSQQIVLPDEGYDAITKVTVNKVNLESGATLYDISGYTSKSPSAGYLGMASVRAYPVFNSISLLTSISTNSKTLTLKPMDTYLNSYNIKQIVAITVTGDDSNYVYGVTISKRGDAATYECKGVAHSTGSTCLESEISGNVTVTCDTAANKFTITTSNSWSFGGNYTVHALYCT